MNIASLTTKEVAAEALKAYRQGRGVYDKQDWEIERIYRQIARGNKVISVIDAIQRAGIDQLERPRLAIARADCVKVRCQGSDAFIFDDANWGSTRWRLVVPWQQHTDWRNLSATVPRIPPQHRPKKLSDYHILWEADWTAIPTDPYLLKRIGKDAWVVLAAWDLTEVEVSVLRAHQTQ